MDWIKPHYDKILHSTVTFVFMMFLLKYMDWRFALAVTAMLQIGKVIWNHRADPEYTCIGDMAANTWGYVLVSFYINI